ncbi:unnamed protein product, partial [Rotaria socialis]
DKDPPDNFDLQTPLKSGFSNLSQQLKMREESDEFGRYAQAVMTDFMNKNLDFALGTNETLALQACYAAADVVNAPEVLTILSWETTETIRLESKYFKEQSLSYSKIQIVERRGVERQLHETIGYIQMNDTEQMIEIESIINIEK